MHYECDSDTETGLMGGGGGGVQRLAMGAKQRAGDLWVGLKRPAPLYCLVKGSYDQGPPIYIEPLYHT